MNCFICRYAFLTILWYRYHLRLSTTAEKGIHALVWADRCGLRALAFVQRKPTSHLPEWNPSTSTSYPSLAARRRVVFGILSIRQTRGTVLRSSLPLSDRKTPSLASPSLPSGTYDARSGHLLTVTARGRRGVSRDCCFGISTRPRELSPTNSRT